MTGSRLLVPVSESNTLRNTVAYAVRRALDEAGEDAHDGETRKAISDEGPADEGPADGGPADGGPADGGPADEGPADEDPDAEADAAEYVSIHFVYPVSERLTFGMNADESPAVADARKLLERVAVWAEEDLGDDADSVAVETALIGTREYLFSPRDYADVITGYARTHDLDSAIFDPGFNPLGTTPLLPTLTSEVDRAGLTVEEANVERPRRGALLVRRGTVTQFLGLFGVSYLFYLLLAGSVKPFELVTGAISAGVVAVSLWRVSLTTPLDPSRTARQSARLVLYVPYLLWEVAKANVEIAYVVLHPDLPIDPEIVEFDAAVWSALPVATLANSITLTPGTLTVDVSKRHFTVHTLTAGTREGLLSGTLERAVRFVFYGRAAARIPSPLERRAEEDDES